MLEKLEKEIKDMKEVRDAFLTTLRELFNPRYHIQKLSWVKVWKETNNKLNHNNSFKNGYGKGKPYPEKDIIKLVEAKFDGSVLEIAGVRVLFSIVRTPKGFVECYKLTQQFERTPNKQAVEAIERALDTDFRDINDMFIEMYAY